MGKNHLPNKEDEGDDEEYEYNDDYDIDSTIETNKTVTSASKPTVVVPKGDLKLKPIKGSDTVIRYLLTVFISNYLP